MATRIHPTALVDSGAQLGEDVEIGPHAVVESDTVIGEGCRLMSHAIVRRYTHLGAGNVLHPFAVLGGEPQDVKFDPATVSWLIVGSGNVFREAATLHRATGEGNKTVVGDNNYFMVYSHAGHNVTVGSGCVLVNGSALGGHSELSDGAILSAHVCVHQFCWVGRMVMSQGNSIITKHTPPYCLSAGRGEVVGLNRVGLRRAPHLNDRDRKQIQEAYRLTYRSRLPLKRALQEMDAHSDWGAAADLFRQFVRRVAEAQAPHRRGLAGARHRHEAEEEQAQ